MLKRLPTGAIAQAGIQHDLLGGLPPQGNLLNLSRHSEL